MLNSSLFPTPLELTDSLFDLTASEFNILPESDNPWNTFGTFDNIFDTEFDQDTTITSQSQWQFDDLDRILAELEKISSSALGQVDRSEPFSAFVEETSLTNPDFASTSTAQIAIPDLAIGVKQFPPFGLTFNLNFDDPTGKYTPYYAAIESNIVAAGLNWNKYIQGKGSWEIDVKFSLTGDAVASGRSLTAPLLRNNGRLGVYEPGAIAELRTGIDPNGASPDIEFNLDPDDLTNLLWFDPNPSTRTAPVPANKIDAVSLFTHEFGHAIAFNGWKSDTDGTLPGNYQSTFDEQVSFDGNNFFFTGTRATAVYGAPVPLNFGNITHLGNDAPRPGSDLMGDLMNPYASFGKRLDISTLDLAILADTGVSINSAPNDFYYNQKVDTLRRNNDVRMMLGLDEANVFVDSLFSPSSVADNWKISDMGFTGGSELGILGYHTDGSMNLELNNNLLATSSISPDLLIPTKLQVATPIL
jgi:hypothetical protein